MQLILEEGKLHHLLEISTESKFTKTVFMMFQLKMHLNFTIVYATTYDYVYYTVYLPTEKTMWNIQIIADSIIACLHV